MAEEPGATQRVEGYTPFDLVERSANVFAREFLLPPNGDSVVTIALGGGGAATVPDAPALARHLGVPEPLVYFQLDARPAPPGDGDEVRGRRRHTADGAARSGQRAAAEWPRGPLLVEAGPGTGKTRTLVHRVTWLLEGGTPPECDPRAHLLEPRGGGVARPCRRVAPGGRAAPLDGHDPRLRARTAAQVRRGAHRRASPGFAVLDPVEARLRFAAVVVSLGLSRYDDLTDPTAPFPAFFSAFSRAKDELADAAQYAALAHAMPPGEEQAPALDVARAFTIPGDAARENACDLAICSVTP